MNLNCPNKTNLRDYQVQVIIGNGAFSTVSRAIVKESRFPVAIKLYDKMKLCQEDRQVENMRQEIRAMQLLDHPGIMKFYDAIDQGNKIAIIVEYINGNNLYQYIRNRPGMRISDEDELRFIFKQIAESVKYMHA